MLVFYISLYVSYVCSFCRGIDLTQWKEKLQSEAEPANLDKFVHHLSENHFFPNRVLVDCTADTSVASHYYYWLKKGIHVITPNKKANSGPLERVMILLTFFSINVPLFFLFWSVD
jgi:aspartokinase/homoserine dehydrogenase 1